MNKKIKIFKFQPLSINKNAEHSSLIIDQKVYNKDVNQQNKLKIIKMIDGIYNTQTYCQKYVDILYEKHKNSTSISGSSKHKRVVNNRHQSNLLNQPNLLNQSNLKRCQDSLSFNLMFLTQRFESNQQQTQSIFYSIEQKILKIDSKLEQKLNKIVKYSDETVLELQSFKIFVQKLNNHYKIAKRYITQISPFNISSEKANRNQSFIDNQDKNVNNYQQRQFYNLWGCNSIQKDITCSFGINKSPKTNLYQTLKYSQSDLNSNLHDNSKRINQQIKFDSQQESLPFSPVQPYRLNILQGQKLKKNTILQKKNTMKQIQKPQQQIQEPQQQLLTQICGKLINLTQPLVKCFDQLQCLIKRQFTQIYQSEQQLLNNIKLQQQQQNAIWQNRIQLFSQQIETLHEQLKFDKEQLNLRSIIFNKNLQKVKVNLKTYIQKQIKQRVENEKVITNMLHNVVEMINNSQN